MMMNCSSSNDMNTMDILDDIENLLFLCDRLNTRLVQVTTYVDEVKQVWINKRRSIETDSNISPLIAQKAIKCNKVLLNVAEKLAVVELQTESLHHLHSMINSTDKQQLPTPIMNAQVPTRSIQGGTNPLTARFRETNTPKPTAIEQQQSAFHRPLSLQDTNQQPKVPTRPSSQYNLSTKLVNGHSNETNPIESKIRVKMQVIPSGTIWRHADIPIVDHPSAFFVSNQDPRVTEQFNMMSIEMNTHYNKPTNTVVPLQNISIGDFCVARFSEDRMWYRARVVLNNNESVLIVFIDYGNSESKLPSEIYPLIEPLARLPAMTVACTLNEAFPSNENFWTQDATDAFTAIVKNRIVEVQFQQGVGQQWPLHFVKVLLDGQSVSSHPKLTSHIRSARNEQIAVHFNDKLTPMEYILYNVPVVESDIYNNNSP